MAEAVGLVASVIGIAGLAGRIAKASYKVASLLEEVHNVPEEPQRHLDQLQLFAPLLADIDDDDGPPALRGALAAAASQCQRAANELGRLVEDLHAQVHTGGRARRKVRAACVVLQKDTWAAHEKRLASAVQMLMMASQMYGLAQQRYLLDLQRSQPNVIVTQILATLPVREAQPSESESSSRQLYRRGLKTRQNRYFLPDLRLGITNITGSLELQYRRKKAIEKRKEAIPVFWFRFQLPKWLSTRTLDSFLLKSQRGWHYNLHASSYHHMGSGTWELTKDLIVDVDQQSSLQKLQRLIADGRLSMHDKINWGSEWSTLAELYTLLSEYGVSFTTYIYPFIPAWGEHDGETQSILEFLKENNDETCICSIIIASYIGTATDFDSVRATIWPDSQFYHSSFVLDRLCMSRWLIQVAGECRTPLKLPSPSVRAFLTRNFLSRGAQLNLNGIGEFVLGPTSSSIKIWLKFLLDALGYHALHCRGKGPFTSDPCWKLSKDLISYVFEQSSPFASPPTQPYELIFDISLQRPYRGSILFGINSYKNVQRAMHGYELLLREQLKVVSELGLDLMAFGEYSSSRWRKEQPIAFWSDAEKYRQFHGKKWPMLLERDRPLRSDSLPILRRSYGPHPSDWKIWFQEPTDEYAGDFWQLVDPAPMSIPGAWVDEQ